MADGGLCRLALATVLLGVACGSYNYTQDWETLPNVLVHRGSAVVTIATFKTRTTLHHQEATFWSNGGESMQKIETIGSSCYDLDVRTCQVTARRRCAAQGERDLPPAEEGMIGPVRFSASDGNANLRGFNTATGQSWTAATGFREISSVTVISEARRVAVVTMKGGVFVYDVDANQVVACK